MTNASALITMTNLSGCDLLKNCFLLMCAFTISNMTFHKGYQLTEFSPFRYDFDAIHTRRTNYNNFKTGSVVHYIGR